MTKFIDISGQRFGRLVAIEVASRDRCVKWMCRCDCGKEKSVDGRSLRSLNTRSCGCLETENRKAGPVKHGYSSAPLYTLWKSMIRRCDPGFADEHPNYSGRGITVCDLWRDNFAAFTDDMGPRPSPKHTIDRIDNNGNYEPGNCRWATYKEQRRNTRVNHLLTYDGRTQSITEWAEELGVKRDILNGRVRLGWSDERILSEPIHSRASAGALRWRHA